MEQIKTVRELFSDDKSWCQKSLALTKYGNPTDPWSDKACRWCLYGAIIKIYGNNMSPILQKVRKYLEDKKTTITFFNDQNNYKDVMVLVNDLNI